MAPMIYPIFVLAGPTASGKSALALRMALDRPCVIINADALQLYDALPLLTAQPDQKDKAKVPHRLYGDLPAVGPLCSAGKWRDMAMPLIKNALAQGAAPLIVGGSGLYLKVLLEGLSPMPPIPQEIRDRAMVRRQSVGPDAFFEEVQQRDPAAAALCHAGHTARVVRIWEIWEATGKPLSAWQNASRIKPPADWHFEVTAILPPRESLYTACNARFLAMMEAGALAEAADFEAKVAHGLWSDTAPVARALGLAPLRAHVRGEISCDEAVSRAQTDTRHYAKRQLTWLRTQLRPAPHITVHFVEEAHRTMPALWT